jgi:putative nucleotidyltransferase with HDIG domain
MRVARILLVEPEEEIRNALNQHLERAGHDVACVADADGARALLEDGLDPDVVLAESHPEPDGDRILRALAPLATHLRILPDRSATPSPGAPRDERTLCSRDPGAVLRRIEETMLESAPREFRDSSARCLDLIRRLAGALPRSRSPEERIDLVVEAFDAYFGVLGTLVLRRGRDRADWIEVSQGLEEGLAARISEEIARRAFHRGLRPFLTRLVHRETTYEIAGLAVQVGETETDLALALARPPDRPELRESLISLVGSALRSAMASDELERTRARLDGQSRSFASLLEMSREFAHVGTRRLLCEAILKAVQRELGMSHSALFLPRWEGDAMLAPQAVAGFPAVLLDRIGLSGAHGVGAACFQTPVLRRLGALPADGVAVRELRMLGDAGLQWAVPVHVDGRPLGLLVFGSREDTLDLEVAEQQALGALLEAASISLRGLRRVEDLRDLSVSALQGLVAASEIRCPEDRGHAERVARASVAVGRALGLAPKDLRDLAVAGLLHDVGKVSAPGNAADARALRLHPVVGSRILSRAKPAPAVVQAVEQHHERWDGQGFPYGLQGAEIHLYARIVAIADAYDRWLAHGGEAPAEAALRRLEAGAGLLFDPGLVAVFSSEVGRGPTSSELRRESWLEDIVAAP